MAATARIAPYIHHTPVLQSRSMNRLVGADLFFKCENFQKTGAFKARGAVNTVIQLSSDIESVVTHSSGNHGAALAWATSLREMKSFVVVPTDASPFKRRNMERYGATLIDCGQELESRESVLHDFLEKHDATFIHPYDDARIITGQGSATVELLESECNVDQIWVPVGGGGLASGAILAANGNVEVVCAEPVLARDAYLSIQTGYRQPPLPPVTIADGLRSSLGELNFGILKAASTQVALASEDSIIHAARLVFEMMKIVIEPSAAVVVAAMLENPSLVAKRVGVILSGGNVPCPHEFG
ncbi:MAG: pyridoxal-phosphate dependent enzyme [Gammaproteobacteria bacterium]|nr:pyridoxal-phosphate dependent enzyme [Gammaproteobacteria bacterium]MYF02812.1 pyridoxal-phosphate dependent enzyme [Gammaproteobacteria bacterium]